jgi:hypothetical protein
MPAFHDWKMQVESLCNIKGDYSATGTEEKIRLLQALSTYPLTAAAFIKKYHDILLFLSSQPDNNTVYRLAQAGLEKIKTAVQLIFQQYAPAKQLSLNGTGISSTETVCSFSYDMARWLCDRFGTRVSLHSCGADAGMVSSILGIFLPGMEYQEITQTGCSLQQRIQKLTGKKDKAASLKWLLDTMHDSITSVAIRNILYEQLQVFVHWKPADTFYSHSFLRSLPQKIFYRQPNTVSIKNYREFILKKIKAPLRLNSAEQHSLVDVARASLALLCRETDPVTFADSKTVKYFNMGYGICIALYTMQPLKRFTIESYIGYMAFKNRVPVAYGGGWLFGKRCKIGINIYPAFRGGDSALLFASVIRLYHHYLGAERFVVKPYQFGKNNADGLRSGAFWFYYKMGFLPVDGMLHKLAAEEYIKKSSVKKYRTSLEVLKQFTHAEIELVLNSKAVPDFDAGLVSKYVTAYMIKNFAGNREQGLYCCAKQLKKIAGATGPNKPNRHQLHVLNKQAAWFAVLFAGNENAVGWTGAEKQQLISLVLSKEAIDEIDYIKNLQAHKKLWQVLNALISR